MVLPKALGWMFTMLSKTLTLFLTKICNILYTISDQNTWFPYTISEQNRWFFLSHFTPEQLFFHLCRDPVYTEHKPLYSFSGLNELQSQRVQIPSLFITVTYEYPPLGIYSRMILPVPLIGWESGASLRSTTILVFLFLYSYKKRIPPPPTLRVLSATPPAGISLSLPRVLMAITPRIWGISSFHNGCNEGSCRQQATAIGSMNRWQRRRCVII